MEQGARGAAASQRALQSTKGARGRRVAGLGSLTGRRRRSAWQATRGVPAVWRGPGRGARPRAGEPGGLGCAEQGGAAASRRALQPPTKPAGATAGRGVAAGWGTSTHAWGPPAARAEQWASPTSCARHAWATPGWCGQDGGLGRRTSWRLCSWERKPPGHAVAQARLRRRPPPRTGLAAPGVAGGRGGDWGPAPS